MGTLYYVRHGQTDWNLEHRVCGYIDIPLNETGIRQAKELGERLAAENFKVDEIIYSDLSRARDTASYISKACGNIPMHEDKRISEQNFGELEGLVYTDPAVRERFWLSRDNFAYRYPGGESALQLSARVYNLLDELTAQKDKVYLIVAHGRVSKPVHAYFHDMTNEEYWDYLVDNCQLVKYEF